MLCGTKSTTQFQRKKKKKKNFFEIPPVMIPWFSWMSPQIKNSLIRSKIDVSFVWLEEEDSSL